MPDELFSMDGRNSSRRLLRDDPHGRAVAGSERDPAQHHRVGRRADGGEVHPREHYAQHLGHLRLRERRADAAPDPAPNGSQV